MRILYLMSGLKHPTMRGELRHYHLLRQLTRRHEVTLVALSGAETTAEALEELAGCTEQLLLEDVTGSARREKRVAALAAACPGGTRATKWLRVRQGVRRMCGTVQRMARSRAFDVALVHGKVIYPVMEHVSPVPVVLDWCDASSSRLRSALSHGRALDLPMGVARYCVSLRRERRFREATPHVAFISRRDRAFVLGPASRATIVPNGVDSEYWARRHAEPESDYLLFTGVMDYQPNEDAALYLVERLLPEIRRTAPHVKVVIGGRNPSPALLRSASHAQEVTVTGSVADLRPYMERALMFVAPMRIASGMQNKLLEAMAMELPVVTTEIAADGLRVEGEGDPPVLVADSPQECAEGVLRLLQDRAARQRVGTAGRAYVLDHFNWERSAAILETMCLEAAMHPTAVRRQEVAAAFDTRRPGEVSQDARR